MEEIDLLEMTKLQLFGGVLESEISDESFKKIIDMSIKELNAYYNETEFKTIAASSCIDLEPYPEIYTVMNVYRTDGVSSSGNTTDGATDPWVVSQLQMYNLGVGAYASNWIYNLGSYSTAQRLANTMSTDLNFRESKKDRKLYINFSSGVPSSITLEYIPRLHDTSEVESEYWQDMLKRLVLAHSKIALGRIRTRYTQSNALWTSDGDRILEEGTNELNDLREKMRTANDMFLPVD